ncbi:MAG: MFS transporter [Candidatus Mcinerneyibacterium aminivorans]|jgi:predicted MFS family arabinose efflux permease|uniref:MFS transporter n=1 Tax=Candidatus Mcinerneyibacterium aminivorans TaxID=2703815 RepID=A0A5D0MHJ8_9BACT|nr:MAG: MFS transporter [Candidatus Mcinerneyibacterium aminivorans]
MLDYLEKIKMISKNAKLFLIGGIFNGIGMSVFRLLFNLYLKEAGFGEGNIGTILSARSLGAALIAIPIAILLRRVHAKYILISATFLASIFYGFQIYFDELYLIVIFAFFAHMFFMTYRLVSAPFFMRNSTKKERIYIFSIHSAVFVVSMFIGNLVGGNLPHLFLNTGLTDELVVAYKITLYISIGFTIGSILPYLKITEKPLPKIENKLFNEMKKYNWKRIIKLIIPRFLVGMGAGFIIPFMNLYFRNEFNLGSDRIGLFFSILRIFMFIGMMSAPLISQKIGMIKGIVLTQLLSLPFMLTMALTNHLTLAVGAFFLRTTLMNMNQPMNRNFTMEIMEKDEQPMTHSLTMVAWNLSWMVSAFLGGRIIEQYGFKYSFFATIILYLLSSTTYYLLFRKFSHIGKGEDEKKLEQELEKEEITS